MLRSGPAESNAAIWPSSGLRLPLKARRRLNSLLAGILLSVGLSAIVAGFVAQQNAEVASERFDALAKRFTDQIEQRFHSYQYGLLTARVAVIAGGGDQINFEKFRQFRQAIDIEAEFPGARGFGLPRSARRPPNWRRCPRSHSRRWLHAADQLTRAI